MVIERVLDKSATPPRDNSSKFSKESRAVVIPKVRFFKVNDQFLIKVLEKAEMIWDINLEEMFR